jgi:hypothetical protein
MSTRRSLIDALDLGAAVRELARAGASSRQIAEWLASAGVRVAPRTVRDWLARQPETREDRPCE